MRKTAVALTLILALLASMGDMTLQAGYCLSPKEHIYEDTVVYTLTGRGVNITLTLDPPENKAYNSTVDFTLKVLESFSGGGGSVSRDSVNPSDYFLRQKTLGVYLISGVILDYDKVKIIDPLWIYWAQTENATYREEEKSLFLNSHDAVFSKSDGTYFGRAVLPELSEGLHNLTVWVRAEQDWVTTYAPFWSAISKTITFTIDTVSPITLFLIPDNTTFETSEMLLNFTVDETFSKIEYSLDGQNNVTIIGNTTLTKLPNGYHNVTVYATDEAGNTGASEILYFNTDTPEPFPAIPVTIAAIVVVLVAGAGLLLHYRERRREAGQ